MKLHKFLYCLFCSAVLITTLYHPVNSTSAEGCKDVEFIFARGSGAPLDAADNTAWVSSLSAELITSRLSYRFYELGTTAYDGAKYSAVSIGFDNGETTKNTLSAIFNAAHLGDFSASIDQGVSELVGRIKHVSNTCKNTRFVIGGYSQGAIVISRALAKLDPEKLIFAVTFGDPTLYLPEGEGLNPPACRGAWYSDYRIYAPNCRAHSGLLGTQKPYAPEGFAGKVGIWCTKNDIFCSNTIDFSDPIKDHISYITYDLYPDAAKYIRAKLADAYPEKVTSDSELTKRDTAILIDSTGSMATTIEKFKATALKIAKETLDAGGNVALFEYRDLADPFEPQLLCDFGCTYAEFAAKIESITPDGGGDIPESALSASLHVMNTLKWHKNATKTIILLTDADYHSPDLDGVTLPQVIQRSLEIDPVNLYAVTPSPSVSDAYLELTDLTGGASFLLDDTASVNNLISSTILTRPEIFFPLEEYCAAPGESITFNLTGSALTNGTITRYEWDLDGDGTFETTTTSPSVTKTFTRAQDFYLQARAVNATSLSSTASARVVIAEPASAPTIKNLTSTLKDGELQLSYEFGANTHAVFVSVSSGDTTLPLGLTDQPTFTVTDPATASAITLTPISSDGIFGTPITLNLASPSILAPNSGVR